jgi:CubicO group peptidase (beta-lactamase class C family)
MNTLWVRLQLVLFFFALCSLPALAQQFLARRLDGTIITPAQIDASVKKNMHSASVTGVGIAIFNRGKIVFLKAYGFRDTTKHLRLTPDSIMTAASLTKPAFATMVMTLVHDRIIELDKPVYEYLYTGAPTWQRSSRSR